MGLFREGMHAELEHRADNFELLREGKSYVARILSELSWVSGPHHHQLDVSLADGGVGVHIQSVPGRTSEGEVFVD